MADNKEIKITTDASKLQGAMQKLQKSIAAAFDPKGLKEYNRELMALEKNFAKMGVTIGRLGRVLANDLTKNLQAGERSMKSLQAQIGAVNKNLSPQAQSVWLQNRASAIYGNLQGPRVASGTDDLHIQSLRMAKEELRSRQEKMEAYGREAASGLERAEEEKLLRRQAIYRKTMVGVQAMSAGINLVTGVGQTYLGLDMARERNAATRAGIVGSAYNRITGGDVSYMTSLLNPENLAKARQIQGNSRAMGYMNAFGGIAEGAGQATLGTALAYFTGGIAGTNMVAGGGVGMYKSGASLVDGSIGTGADKAYEEALLARIAQDPVKAQAINNLASSGLASHYGKFGRPKTSIGAASGGKWTQSNGLLDVAEQTAFFGMDWRQTMGLREQLTKQMGLRGADASLPLIAGSEQVFGMSGESTAGALTAMTQGRRGGGDTQQKFIETMAKAVARGVNSSNLKEDVAQVIATYEMQGGRSGGAGDFMAMLFAKMANGTDNPAVSQEVQRGMGAANQAFGQTTGWAGAGGFAIASRALNDVANKIGRRNTNGLRPQVTPMMIDLLNSQQLNQLAAPNELLSNQLEAAGFQKSTGDYGDVMHRVAMGKANLWNIDPFTRRAMAKLGIKDVGGIAQKILGSKGDMWKDNLDLRKIVENYGYWAGKTLGKRFGSAEEAMSFGQTAILGADAIGRPEEALDARALKAKQELAKTAAEGGDDPAAKAERAKAQGNLQLLKDMSDAKVAVVLEHLGNFATQIASIASQASGKEDPLGKFADEMERIAASAPGATAAVRRIK